MTAAGLSEESVRQSNFVRDRLTGMAYGGLATYAYVLYALGPLLPLLRQDLRFGYAVMSLHSTAFAAGAVLTNLLFERIRRRLGYRTLFWVSAASLVAGGLLLATGAFVAVTLMAAAVAGIGGSLLQTTVLALLSEHHGRYGPLRDRALVEANASASASALAAPLVIGGLQAAGAAWNWSLILPLAMAVVMYAVFRREPLRPGTDGPVPGTAGPGAALRLPTAFWILAALAGVVVGAEFCFVFYGSPQLTTVVGLTTGQAATAMSLFYSGELLGRLAGSRLTGTGALRSTPQLVVAALAVSAVGFLALWTTSVTWVALAGLFLSGFGMANLFPLTLSLAVSGARGQSGRATASVQLLVGAAIMLAPLLLGSLSDLIGVRAAFGAAGLLIPLAALLLALGHRTVSPEPQGTR
ncbi:MFS transporter [Streptomyces sp. NPDC005799]|uniref:MFS transporter n=1 Tax=Streptomyces sp. NPDC005799 TaxID=3154678 RepID=UPI003403EB3C